MSAPSPRAALRTRTLSARGGCIGHRAPSCVTASLVLHLDRGGANRGLRRLALLRHRSSQRQKTTRGSTWHRTSQQITAAPSETSAKPPGTSAEGTTRKQATINQSVSHLEPVSLTLLRCVLRSRAATAELIHQGVFSRLYEFGYPALILLVNLFRSCKNPHFIRASIILRHSHYVMPEYTIIFPLVRS